MHEFSRDRVRGFNEVPLDHPTPLEIGAEVFRDKEGHRRRSWRTILGLSVLVGILLIATATFSVLYATRINKTPKVQMVITTTTASTTLMLTSTTTATLVSTSTRKRPTTETVTSVSVTVQTTTASRTKYLTSLVTTTLISTQPTTVTSISVSTETARHKIEETTSVTTIITTTLYLTTTQTSSLAASSSSTLPPSSDGKCIPPGTYGGEELHVLNAGYDLDIASAVETAASAGVDIGSGDSLVVGLRSIFMCVTEDDLELIAACRQGYLRSFDGIACSGTTYTTTTSGTTPLSQVPVSVPSTMGPSTTATTTDEVLVTVTQR